MRLPYIAALSLVALLTLGAQVLLHVVLKDMSADSTVINVAGRQRMLSQRIAAKAATVESARAAGDLERAKAVEDRLGAALELWTSSHVGLLSRDEDMGLGGENSPKIAALFEDLLPHYKSVVADVGELLQREATRTDASSSGRSVAIGDAADAFLPIMNSIVFEYDGEASAKLAVLKRIEITLGTVTLLLLLFEALFVFEPAVRRIKRLSAEAEAARKSAEAASEAKSAFLANMSHEIRTPMTAIVGYLDLLSEGVDRGSMPEEHKEFIDSVRRNGDHLLSLINDILDVSKIEAGQMSVEMTETHPAQIVEDVASLMGARTNAKGVNLRVVYETPLPDKTISDPTRLRQILLNLTGNAAKFTERGSVTIHVGYVPEDGVLWLRVVDTGIGMDRETTARIQRFDAFQQAEDSTTRRFGGTGLGLCISAKLAEMLGGGIEIESKPGVGSSFTVRVACEMPEGSELIQPEAASQIAESERAANRPGRHVAAGDELKGYRVLLAEDGRDNQRLISFHLRRAGADVEIEENGRLALERALDDARPPFDIVLMDMQMPEMDGYSATRRLRAAGYRGPIVALTAHAMQGDREKCIDAGCDEHLTKPLQVARMLEVIGTLSGDGESSKAA